MLVFLVFYLHRWLGTSRVCIYNALGVLFAPHGLAEAKLEGKNQYYHFFVGLIRDPDRFWLRARPYPNSG